MRIGIIELMPTGHYTLVESLIKIFSVDTTNKIIILTNRNGFVSLKHFQIADKIEIIVGPEDELPGSTLTDFTARNFDMIYITTMEKYFSSFNTANFNADIRLFIHNIDDWFCSSVGNRCQRFLYDLFSPINIVYNIKRNLLYPAQRKIFIKKIHASNGKFVVLSSILKDELSHYVDPQKIEVIPFSVYDESLSDNSAENKFLRLCIPGMVSQLRRDYLGLFRVITKNFEFFVNNIEIDLLGKVYGFEGGNEVIQECKKLVQHGVRINYYDEAYVPMQKYDDVLSRADLILGNMNLRQGKASFYGRTKDTGIIFNMIKAAKPGLLPEGYPIIQELESSSLVYTDYTHLISLLRDLVTNKEFLAKMKAHAVQNSKYFLPENIYRLVMAK